jgi:hypothetical protein
VKEQDMRHTFEIGVMTFAMGLMLACHPTPPTPMPPIDASDAAPFPTPSLDGGFTTACVAACAALKAASCSEGSDPACAASETTMEAHRLDPNPQKGNLPLTCADVSAVKTAADVRALHQKCNGSF